MSSWKSPGLRYQWRLENSTSIRLHSSSAVTNKTSVLNTEHAGMLWAAASVTDFWSEPQISDMLPAVCCRPPPALQRQNHSSLGYFSSSCPACCWAGSLTRRRTDSCLPCPCSCFHFVLPSAKLNSMQLRKRNGWEGCGQQWGEPSNKKLSGCDAETVYCVSGLLAARLLMRDGWCLCHLC